MSFHECIRKAKRSCLAKRKCKTNADNLFWLPIAGKNIEKVVYPYSKHAFLELEIHIIYLITVFIYIFGRYWWPIIINICLLIYRSIYFGFFFVKISCSTSYVDKYKKYIINLNAKFVAKKKVKEHYTVCLHYSSKS